jgi:uncharacterized RDD family membrane protein YckC
VATATTTGSFGLVTPEAVLLELEVADYASRLAARTIDALIQAAALAVVGLVMAVINAAGAGLGQTFVVVVLAVTGFAVLIVYPIAFETLGRGRTIGKRAIGLRVLSDAGGPITFRHAAVRGVLAVIDVLPGGILATLSMLVDRRCRRLGDLAAGTVVVRERRGSAPTQAIWFPIPPGWEAYAAALPVVQLTSAQYELIRRYLLRVNDLTIDARASLGHRIATEVAGRLGVPVPAGHPPEVWLQAVLAGWQRRPGR